LFALESFLIADFCRVLGQAFLLLKLCIDFDEKNVRGDILGDFLTNSSGHPAQNNLFGSETCVHIDLLQHCGTML
jgi:hypothetical protein